MFRIWHQIDELKLDKAMCALMMVLVLINPDRQMPNSIRTELEQINVIQEQYVEGKWFHQLYAVRTECWFEYWLGHLFFNSNLQKSIFVHRLQNGFLQHIQVGLHGPTRTPTLFAQF